MAAEKIAGEVARKAAEKFPSWIERVLVPSLNEIRGELKAINTRIDSTNERITGLESKMDTRIDSTNERITGLESIMDTRITSLRNEILSKFEGVDHRFEGMNYRFDAIDIKLDSLESAFLLSRR